MVERLRAMVGDASGSTAIEYALLATLIGTGILGALQLLFNDRVTGLFGFSTTRLLGAMGL